MMQEEIIDILEENVIELSEELKQKHIDLGMRATGDWLDSVEVVRNGTNVSIYAEDYTEYLVNGRGPGGRPPISNLERWVNAKLGVSGPEGKSIAFAVANKISRDGTDYYPEGTDLIDGVLTEDRLQEVVNSLGDSISVIIRQFVQRNYENAFA